MKPWLEDLSEEWIPQPAPPPLTQNPDNAATMQTCQSVPSKPRSRLPRLRNSSGSFSEIQIRQLAKESRPTPPPKSALAERTLSDINIPSTTTQEAPRATDSRCVSLSSPTSATGSVICNGTVEQKPAMLAPGKPQQIHDTPEWRRRLLKGEVGYGEQRDLFSPMGLENIFQKPTAKAPEEAKQPKSKLALSRGLNNMPSSPPPWPSRDQEQSATRDKDGVDYSGLSSKMVQDLQRIAAEDSAFEGTFEQARAGGSFSTHVPGSNNYQIPRTVSGQIEFENESFSPVYLSTNLKIGATVNPSDPNLRGSDLANRLRHLGSPPPTSNSNPASEGNTVSVSQEDSSMAKLRDDTLPEDLPAGTPEYADVGRFVELRRGGYSRDGSFRRRPLSPSPRSKAPTLSMPGNPTLSRKNAYPNTPSIVEPEAAGQSFESDSPPSPDPVTPRRHDNARHLSPARTKSRSPLKLFDAHDTFTSNRLQRRLSQLEYKSEQTTLTNVQSNQAHSAREVKKDYRLTLVEEVSIQKPAIEAKGAFSPIGQHSEAFQVETFGEGQLDAYQFPEELSSTSSQALDDRYSAPDSSPTSDIAPPGSRQPPRFHFDESLQLQGRPKAKRQGLTRVSNQFRARNPSNSQSGWTASGPASSPPLVAHPIQEYTEGKRGPTSPFKNPTPKRRRTLYSIDGDDDDVFSESGPRSVKETHAVMQSIIGRKRKDARHEQTNNVADPDVLARRHILRPRNPTPSQRRKDEIEAEILEATEAFILSSPKLNTIREHLNSPVGPKGPSERNRAAAVASEVAAFSMKRTQAMKDESRKRSVTTQDFLDEAVKIMEFIRTKGRPTSGLGSVEETESESPIKEDCNPLPSTPLTFSRPPSREGHMSQWREPNKRELDPQVMSHLRKFQEKESDDFMGSSIRSLRFSRMKGPVSPEGNSIVIEQDNIRITDNQDRHVMRDIDDGGVGSQPRTNGTHPSTGSSMGQTIATNTSRRSEHVATLAPEAVAHLIPEHIAGMSFDREKNIWVRQKSPIKETRPNEDLSNANESEEDPFGNIPDLTVDETAELRVNKALLFKPTAETFLEESEDFDCQNGVRPVTREGKGIPPPDTSSVPSKASNFAWSFPKTETRATSWSDQETRSGGTQIVRQPPTTYSIPESDENDVEHEIKYFEGRGTAKPTVQSAHVRDITISISSPHPPLGQDFQERDNERTEGLYQESISPRKNVQQKWTFSSNHQTARSKRATWRQMAGAKTLPNARATPIREHDELPLLDDLPSRNYRMQLSMSVTTPVLGVGQPGALIPAGSPPARAGDVTFMLSDLPEFTLNQVDECELPDRVVMKHNGTKFSQALEDRYALGTAELVKALQDVQPDEPYWEELRQVDLHGKSLTNLHRLDEFCCRLEDLDVSDNSISHVAGIPFTIRRLKAHNNCLTGLTSWASLMNLQYLDISGNDIDRLDGLNQLLHLRTLRLGDNKIKTLSGILHLDGLMELNAEANLVETVDFAKSDLKSLTTLVLRGNRLSKILNLHCLPRLQHLDLDDNCIKEFPVFDMPTGRNSLLRSLRICRNEMTSLIIDTYCPNLESLYVDGNALTQVSGLENLTHLRTLSAREQVLGTDSDPETCVGNLMRNSDVRNLYISLNSARSLDISQHLLNLQRVELASMGLKELPQHFGQLTPNIRSINLNFNSIKDLRPLLNVKKLNELLVAGNKLSRLRTNLAVLAKLITLTKLDMRDNSLTLRFYPSVAENRVISLNQKPIEDDRWDRFILPDGDQEADKQYLLRLDDETRLRRRVYEMMLATSCSNLRELDGLQFDKARILVKDDIWERLLYLGVIRRSEKTEEIHDREPAGWSEI
ncbi:uncharacterized protein BDR25DRAFT_342032 [Lindgomyces ingoldianus]|uniref:Uncharacterized protein n=1 Tax=Lindgomyces ingoldianus TaxID=673940 RepID=A0ACB6QYB6_9PLEO|nr:uncharacterized protein BDR25DRAFT_342032 [Lindgomyces ingoldianus]KAF2471988.1 hypothetical protein BDR25DRAFT_342032 [Lindgomyces ingoldianus]